MVQHISENRRVLRQTFSFIQEAHEGVVRSRNNSDGKPRSYDHHPMEVALFYAEMEIFQRRCKRRNLSSEQAADKIIEFVEHIAHMTKRQLKSRLYALSKHMDHEQMTMTVGLLCHDTIESAYEKSDSDRIKKEAVERRVAEIKALRDGAEDIALRLTDSSSHKSKLQKRTHQVRLARKRKYASLKKYDIIPNMADQMLIPHTKRSRKKKRAVLKHMHRFMRAAFHDKNIPFSYYLASERIYKKAKAQLG